jgi:hypothetical protein
VLGQRRHVQVVQACVSCLLFTPYLNGASCLHHIYLATLGCSTCMEMLALRKRLSHDWDNWLTCRQGHGALRASLWYKYNRQSHHSSHQPWWWRHR